MSFRFPDPAAAGPRAVEPSSIDLVPLIAALVGPATEGTPVDPSAVSGDPLAPAGGAFNAGMAARLATWSQAVAATGEE